MEHHLGGAYTARADGWVAEIAIPFRSISYVEGDEGWGFEFTRSIRRKNETVRWSSLNPALRSPTFPKPEH
jgi:hypothetical protein